jgi:hypothetical protein
VGFPLPAPGVGPSLYRKVRKNNNDGNNGKPETIHDILLGRGFSACILWDCVRVIAVAFFLQVYRFPLAGSAAQLCDLKKIATADASGWSYTT